MDAKDTTRTFTNVYNLKLTEGDEQKTRTFTNQKNLPITNDISKGRNFTNRKNLPLTIPKTQERTFTNRNNLSIDAKKVTKTDPKVTSNTVTKVFPKTALKVASKTATKVSSKVSSNIGKNKIDTFNNLTKVEKLPTNQRKVSVSGSFTIKKENSTKKTEVKLRPVAKGKERRAGTVTKPNFKIPVQKENIEEKSGGILENSEKNILIESMKHNMENKIEPKGR